MKNLFLTLPHFFSFHYYLFTYEILRCAQNDIFAPWLTSTEPCDYCVVFLYIKKRLIRWDKPFSVLLDGCLII